MVMVMVVMVMVVVVNVNGDNECVIECADVRMSGLRAVPD